MIYGFYIGSLKGRKNLEIAFQKWQLQGKGVKLVFCADSILVVKVK